MSNNAFELDLDSVPCPDCGATGKTMAPGDTQCNGYIDDVLCSCGMCKGYGFLNQMYVRYREFEWEQRLSRRGSRSDGAGSVFLAGAGISALASAAVTMDLFLNGFSNTSFTELVLFSLGLILFLRIFYKRTFQHKQVLKEERDDSRPALLVLKNETRMYSKVPAPRWGTDLPKGEEIVLVHACVKPLSEGWYHVYVPKFRSFGYVCKEALASE